MLNQHKLRPGPPRASGPSRASIPTDGLSFSFTDRIPRERGLGSSAATVALGLVAGALVAGREPDPEELLRLGVDLEGHPDNLAAALAGGVCLTWDGSIARIADRLPAEPIALIPGERVGTAAARAALPPEVPHADAAHTAGRATLLGAAIASGSAELFAAALDDRLHEPYRAANAPLLAAVRDDLPAGALGATISGSGPTVIVWARRDAVGGLRGRAHGPLPGRAGAPAGDRDDGRRRRSELDVGRRSTPVGSSPGTDGRRRWSRGRRCAPARTRRARRP